MPRKERDWEVGPVLKDKPGSQGTLFRGGTKYSSDARFPRGYTPERLDEVRSAVKPTGWREDNPVGAHVQRTQITDTLARSTAPTEHLQGLQWAHVPRNTRILSGTKDEPDAAGAYFGQSKTIAVKPGFTRSSTVLHELGHHVSHSQPTEHSQNYSYESAHGGQEEAFADNYAEQHYRDRRGNPESRGTYGGGQHAGRIQRSDEFWSGYHKNRDNRMYAESVRQQDEEYYKRYPEERVHPDGSTDEPLITKEHVSMYDAHPRTPEIDINPDAKPNRWY